MLNFQKFGKPTIACAEALSDNHVFQQPRMLIALDAHRVVGLVLLIDK